MTRLIEGKGDYRRRDDHARRRGSGGGASFYIGKPTTSLTAGALTGKQVQPRRGPAWGGSDADVGSPRDVDYSTGDFGTGDYVVVTLYRGKWYVTCLVPEA